MRIYGERIFALRVNDKEQGLVCCIYGCLFVPYPFPAFLKHLIGSSTGFLAELLGLMRLSFQFSLGYLPSAQHQKLTGIKPISISRICKKTIYCVSCIMI
jgi:hypothetical protein